MNTINERVRMIRKEKGMTLDKFGAVIGVGKTAVSSVETGKNNLSPQMATAICREFGVSMEWLQEGTGPMFAEQPSADLGDLVTRYHLDQYDQAFVLEYMELAPEARAIVKQYMMDVLNRAGEIQHDEEDDIDSKVEEYRQSLLADKERREKAAAASSTSMPPAADSEETA